MSQFNTLSTSQNLERILDENNCPVARMRLFSQGIQTNNRIVMYEPITGDKGCLTCGNCIDACPVVREKRRYVFIQNQRTSMALENIVGEECRRCYACVKACPQVNKTTKEFVWGFRRGEKFVHAYTAGLIVFLAGTGIFTFHFSEAISGWQQLALKASHVFTGFLLLLTPILYFLLDSSHMKQAIKKAFRFGTADLAWLKDFQAYLKSPRRRPLPAWTEFNTYHKIWYCYLLVVVPVLGLTGIVNLIGEDSVGPVLIDLSFWTHTLFALSTDLLVLVHIYFKLLRHIFRNVADMGHCFKKNGTLHYPFLYDIKAVVTTEDH